MRIEEIFGPREFVGYSYSYNNPLNYTDPSGHFPVKPPNSGPCLDGYCDSVFDPITDALLGIQGVDLVNDLNYPRKPSNNLPLPAPPPPPWNQGYDPDNYDGCEFKPGRNPCSSDYHEVPPRPGHGIGLRYDRTIWVSGLGGLDINLDLIYLNDMDQLDLVVAISPTNGIGGGAAPSLGVLIIEQTPDFDTYSGSDYVVAGAKGPLVIFPGAWEIEQSTNPPNSQGSPSTLYIGVGPLTEVGVYENQAGFSFSAHQIVQRLKNIIQ